MKQKFILDGEARSGDTVSVSLNGAGFAYGYGVFETIKVRQATACYLGEHIERLRCGLAEADMDGTVELADVARQARQLIDLNGLSEGVIKVVAFEDLEGTRLALFVRDYEAPKRPDSIRLRESVVGAHSLALTSRCKTLNYMETVRDLRRARREGFGECVYRNESGWLTECSVSNLFFVVDGCLKTPAVSCGLLEGIVRAKVIGIAKERGLEVQEGAFPVDTLLEAEEAFITNSGVGICPVSEFRSLEGRESRYGTEFGKELGEAYDRRELEDLGS